MPRTHRQLAVFSPFCKVCGQPASGNHFGIASCRACAAFFRRAASSKWGSSPCKSTNCERKLTPCKPCRLKKCYEQGMSTNNFQYNRDIFRQTVPQTCGMFVGRPELVMFCDPSDTTKKTFIDIQKLIDNAARILKKGPETPVTGRNQLQKLANGFAFLNSPIAVRMLKTMSKEETADCWEYYLTSTAKWLTYFDEFQTLPHQMQLEIVKSVWHTWGRLEKHALTAVLRKQNLFTDRNLIVVGRNALVNVDDFDYDHTWLTNYPLEQVEYFTGVKSLEFVEVVEMLMRMEPTHVELTYMLAQLSFQYAGARYQGDILKATERFQQILSDDLHDYYVREAGRARYSDRLAQMMKINNTIQKYIRDIRPRAELARTFRVFTVEFSHPEVFQDTGF